MLECVVIPCFLPHPWQQVPPLYMLMFSDCPDSKVHGANMGPVWGPYGANRTQVGPMMAPWTLLSGYEFDFITCDSKFVIMTSDSEFAFIINWTHGYSVTRYIWVNALLFKIFHASFSNILQIDTFLNEYLLQLIVISCVWCHESPKHIHMLNIPLCFCCIFSVKCLMLIVLTYHCNTPIYQ